MLAVLGFIVSVVLTTTSTAFAQTQPPCPRGSGSGLITLATLGGAIRDGQGIGAVRLGSTPTDVERAWGSPMNCLPQRRGFSYNYFLTEDGGRTGWLVVVVFVEGKATDLAVTAVPHAQGPGPELRTVRGVAMFAAGDEVRRSYGPPGGAVESVALYTPNGIAFFLYRDNVGGIFVFRPGTTPSTLRP